MKDRHRLCDYEPAARQRQWRKSR